MSFYNEVYMTDPKMKNDFAAIESIVTDQGNGMSYCNNCKTTLDIQKLAPSWKCPGCGNNLTFGKIYSTPGSSYF